jgi:serine/threonine protein kinase
MDCSLEALDIIEKMLEKNPENRPSATECLKFPWFKEAPKKSLKLIIQKSVLGMTSGNLKERRNLKLLGRISESQVMKVQNLIQDLLKNGLDLSNLSYDRR